MKLQVFKDSHQSLKTFNKFLGSIDLDNHVYFELNSEKKMDVLAEQHKKLFSWHFSDSLRSFTNPDIENLSVYSFSYMNRFSKHFGINQLERASSNLNHIIGTWDPKIDMDKSPKPCLLLLKFVPDGKFLHLSVVFRNRDLIRRLIPNWYCLMNLQKKVALEKNMKIGMLFDYSLAVMIRKSDKILWEKNNG